MKRKSKVQTLTVTRADGQGIDIPYQNPVNLDVLIRELIMLRELEISRSASEAVAKAPIPA